MKSQISLPNHAIWLGPLFFNIHVYSIVYSAVFKNSISRLKVLIRFCRCVEWFGQCRLIWVSAVCLWYNNLFPCFGWNSHSSKWGAYLNRYFLISPQKTIYMYVFVEMWYSLELPCRGNSNEYPQYMFLWRNMNNFKWQKWSYLQIWYNADYLHRHNNYMHISYLL